MKVDENKVFRINRYDNISSLDPTFARTQPNNWVCDQIYSQLVQIDDQLQIKPDVAKSWEISKDGKTYSFVLKKEVFFHKSVIFGKDSTRNVVASDFVYSFNRLKDPKIGGAGSWILNNVDTYQAKNDSVFVITLKTPFPPMLGLLSMNYCSVVPKEAFKNGQDEFFNHPIGTGPFAFKIWEKNVKLVLRKNNLYFEKDQNGKQLPYLEAVDFTFLPEKNSEFLQLLQGKLDLMADLDPSYKDELLTPFGALNPKYENQFKMLKFPYLSTVYLAFYLDGNQVVDKDIRMAIALGIDKDKIIKYLMKGIGFPGIGGFIPKGLPGYSENSGIPYQPEKARELINNYLKKNGQLPVLKLTTVQENADFCEYLQAELAKLGLNIQIDVVPGPTLRDGKATGKFSFFRANWGADYPDAENFLSLYYAKNFAPEGPNYTHYKSENFDQLYQESFLESDLNKRAALYQKMDEMVIKNVPVIPIFYDQTTIFIQKNIHGFTMNPVKTLNLTRVYKQ